MPVPAQPAGPSITVAAGATAGSAVRAAGLPGKGPDAVVVVREADGHLRDLSWAPGADTLVQAVAADTDEGRSVSRHSAAHVMAQAVQALFPDVRLGIGPPITDGFYYDFALDRAFTPEDLVAVEKRMRQIIKGAQRFARRELASVEAAEAELVAEPFKLELIRDKSGVDDPEIMEVGPGALTIYDNLDPRTGEAVWSDLCRGPHLPTTKHIPAFALTRSSAAYWRGDQANASMQRVYGTAWESPEALEQHVALLAEAERRDHRRLGSDLDLFSFPDEIGSGLAVFHPRGGTVRRVMEDYSRRRHEQAGYSFVNTPHITKEDLFLTSGHLPYFADTMFPPMQFEGTDYYLKPMNCPFHILVFKSRGRSYRELPQRLFEFGTVYRYERSGVVHGLTRVRGLTMDDAHIFTTSEDMGAEISGVLDFVLGLLRDFGLTDFYLELSTRGESEKFMGDDDQWARATEALTQAAAASGLALVPDPGGAAFYGPKISVQARDAIGRTWQMSTIQVDFNLPERFDVEYTAADGTRQRPVMIHRALFGSIERFFGVLVEHYAGAFPAWLAPVQVVGIPVAADYADHLDGVAAALRAVGIRVEVDHSDERMQKKIRTHTTQKVPFMLLAGERDVQAGAVSFRFLDGTQVNGVPVAQAVATVQEWVARRENASPTAELVQPG